MRKVSLRMNGEQKYQIIKELADRIGNKQRAALKLGVTFRTIDRLLTAYRRKGKAASVHKNRCRLPANSLSKEMSDSIVSLFREKYDGFNFAYFKDLLAEYENIDVYYATVYRLLRANGILSPHTRRAARKKLRKAKLLAENPSAAESKRMRSSVARSLSKTLTRASSARNTSGKKSKWTALSISGSANGKWRFTRLSIMLPARLSAPSLTGRKRLSGYFHVFDQILRNYGIPAKFKTDNRSVFYYRSSAMKDNSKDVLTQFNYACRQLGVQLETTGISQAKGAVERANQTFQYRLVNELRFQAISSIEQANQFLIASFIPKYNRIFADRLVGFRKGTDCLVIKALDGQLFASVDDRVCALREISKHAVSSPEFDVPVPSVPKKRYIPPMSHPWKRSYFLRIQQQTHRQFRPHNPFLRHFP